MATQWSASDRYLPSTISKSESLLIAIGHREAAAPDSAIPGRRTTGQDTASGQLHNDGGTAGTGTTLSLSIADTSGFTQRTHTAAPKTSNTAAMMNGACHDP